MPIVRVPELVLFHQAINYYWQTINQTPLEIAVSLFLFFILATSKVISQWIPTCDSAQSLQLYSDVALGK